MKLVGNGCEKAKQHLNPSSGKPKNAAFATPTHGAERAPSKPLKLSMARPEHGTTWMKWSSSATDAKRKPVGNGCEKAKHHLNPSSRKPKNAAFTTPTHGAERAPSKPLKLSMAQPEHGTSWMKLVGNGCEKAKHHLNLSSGNPKNAAFATPTQGAERAPSKPLKLSMARPEHMARKSTFETAKIKHGTT